MISTHILDAEEGVPAAGIKVGLYRGAEQLSLQETDDDGRIAELSPHPLDPGEYRLVFYVDGPFFERVDLTLAIIEDRHYHVPLLLSSYSCTTYRGS